MNSRKLHGRILETGKGKIGPEKRMHNSYRHYNLDDEEWPLRTRLFLLIKFHRYMGHDMIMKHIKQKLWKWLRIRLKPMGIASGKTYIIVALIYTHSSGE